MNTLHQVAPDTTSRELAASTVGQATSDGAGVKMTRIIGTNELKMRSYCNINLHLSGISIFTETGQLAINHSCKTYRICYARFHKTFIR